MRWFRNRSPWFLVASLAANLFFVGLITAAVFIGPLHSLSSSPPVRWMMKAAGPEAAPAIKRVMGAREAEMRQARDAYRVAKAEMRSEMTAKVVDPERLRDALTRRTAARAAMLTLYDEVFVEVAPELSLDARQRMTERRWRRNHDRKKAKDAPERHSR